MKMRIALIIALLVLFPILVRCEDRNVKYQDDVLHFTFSVPIGWEKIDDKVLVEFINSRRNEAIEGIRFDAAFQRISDKWFEYPFFVVQIHNKTASLSSLLEAIKKEHLPGGGDFTNTRINKSKKCLVAKSYLGSPKNISEYTVIAMFPGKKNIIQLNFHSARLDQDESDINSIIKSFSFSKGYGYPNFIARFINSLTNNWEKGVAAGMIAFFVSWYGLIKKKKREPFNPFKKN
jgi:hypothetical protein